MRKLLSLFIAGILCVSLCACGNTAAPIESTETEAVETVPATELSDENWDAFVADLEETALRSCDKYLYTFEKQMKTASYKGIAPYIEHLCALNIPNLYIDILSAQYSFMEMDTLRDVESDLLQLIPMVMFFHEKYDMEASNITNVWCVGYDDAGNANNALPDNARILWVKDELNSSTIGFIAYEQDGQTFYDYAYFNDDAIDCLCAIEKDSASGKCVYTESKYVFLSQKLQSILKLTDGMDYTSLSPEETEEILNRGTQFFEVLWLYRNSVYWKNIQLERAGKTDTKTKCSWCNGTGSVKYNYGSSDLEAILDGHDASWYGQCGSCGGTGYSN